MPQSVTVRVHIMQVMNTEQHQVAADPQTITRYACLLPQLSPGTHSGLTVTTEGGLRLSRPGCLVLA